MAVRTPRAAVPSSPRWFRGELHAHSLHSDGRAPVGELVKAARVAGLDFLAITDHFTAGHWDDLSDDELILLRSMELTSHRGHANLHGLRRWVDTYVDRPEHTMRDVTRDVHAQGGLVCVNHAFSGDQAWSRFDTPWNEIDLIEIAHLQQGANNDAQIGLWDRLLCAGHRVIGVGGSDCHDPADPGQALGQVVTVVHAERGDERGILDGLMAGRVWVGRGAEMDMRVDGVPMGGTAEPGRVRIEVEARADEPVSVFVIRDGLLLAVLPGGDGVTGLDDVIDGPGYYRAEVHAAPAGDDPRFWASARRDHASLRAAGNPVWINAKRSRS